MKSSCTAAPLWLNGWKHHLDFISREIGHFLPQNEHAFIGFCQQLKLMGRSLSDLYIGKLSPLQIREQMLHLLANKHVLTPEDYAAWLDSAPASFQEVLLSDHSRWTLLKGKDPAYYIHVHPSRYSPLTLRMNTNLLKTATAWMAWKKTWPGQGLSPQTISMIRSHYLDLSAVNESQMIGISRTIHLLENHLKH
ncbi:MAG: hypothetical protein R6U64_03825 [Bacteroidales bacterium]